MQAVVKAAIKTVYTIEASSEAVLLAGINYCIQLLDIIISKLVLVLVLIQNQVIEQEQLAENEQQQRVLILKNKLLKCSKST